MLDKHEKIVLPLSHDKVVHGKGPLLRQMPGDDWRKFANLRLDRSGREGVLVAVNFTPVQREGYRVGVPWGGVWRELLNTDAGEYWGSGKGNAGEVTASDEPFSGRPHSVSLTLPPLSVLYLKGTAGG